MPPKLAFRNVRPSDLPAPPQTALEIMRACADPQCTHQTIAHIVGMDPVLTAELLRVVNSPYFGLGREIRNMAHAVSLLGQKALRSLVLCISVRDALSQKALASFDSLGFWEDALRRSVAARLLGTACGADPDECFTAGLLQDFGLLILFHVNPELASLWSDLRTQTPDERLEVEQGNFGTTHDVVLMTMAQAWCLPQDFAAMLGHHHDYSNPKLSPSTQQYCRILYCADWLTTVFSCRDTASVLEQAVAACEQLLKMSREQANACLSELPKQVEQAAHALGLRVSTQVDFDTLLKATNVQLAEENLSYQELTWRLKKAVEDRDRYAAALDQEMYLAQEVQRGLLPRAKTAKLPICGVNLPAKILSGDFYDYFVVGNKLFFIVADVSGKGVTAALLMVKTCSLFHCLIQENPSLSPVLKILNAQLCETSIRGMFVTLIAGCYDPAKDQVVLINAGHLPALIARGGKVVEIPAQAPPLGILEQVAFNEITFKLDNSALYAFTDGITEHQMSNGKMLEMDGVKSLLIEFAALAPTARLDAVLRRVTEQGTPLRDDITLILLERGYGK